MFDISPVQIIIVLAIALLIFGPKRLPEMGRSIGRGIRDFKDGLTSDTRRRRRRVPHPPAIEGDTAEAEPTLEEIVKENATPEPVEDESRGPSRRRGPRGRTDGTDIPVGPRRARPDDRLSVVEHLDELRRRAIVCVLALVVAFAGTYAMHDALIEALTWPLPGDSTS